MENVPKIVRARLQRPASTTADVHPEADLLTAFAEQSLAGSERDQVLEHLARCGECRDVVALALPAAESATLAPSHSPARVDWLSWPVLRWGVVTAGIVAMTSVGILQYRQRHQEKTMVATRLNSPDQLADTAAQSPRSSSPATAAQPVTPQAEMRKQVETVKKEPARVQGVPVVNQTAPAPNMTVSLGGPIHRSTSANAIHGATAGFGYSGRVGSGYSLKAAPRPGMSSVSAGIAKQNPTPDTDKGAKLPPATTTVEVSGESPLVATQTTAQNQLHDELVQNSVQAEEAQESVDHVDKAKPASAQASSTMAPSPLLRTEPTLRKLLAAPRWTISASGALQRSLNGGKTWLDVDVAASADDPRTTFRAVSVSSNPAEVWAGGSGGALYHTVDDGNHWTRVVPSDAAAILTGDVTSIQFSNPRSGVVTTSNAEVWTTVDAGQAWHKQR